MNNKIDVSYFKNQVNSAEDLMYEAKESAVNAIYEMIEDNDDSIKLNEPVSIVDVEGTEYLIDELLIDFRGNACIAQEGAVFGFFLFDTPTVIEFCQRVAEILSE